MQNKQTGPLNKKRAFHLLLIDFFFKSAIINSVFNFTAALYKRISKSMTSAIISSYGNISAWFARSAIVNLFKPLENVSPNKTLSYKISAKFESSIFALTVDKIKWALLTCQLNVLAVFGITFGFTSSTVLILQNFAFKIQRISLPELLKLANPLMASICFIIVSILLLFSKKPLIQVVNDSLIFNYILFELLRIRKIPYYDYEDIPGLSVGSSALIGILMGACSFFIQPSKLVAALFVAIIFVIIMHSPESGAVGIFFFIPFISTMSLVFLVCSVALSLFIKLLRRKRSLKIEAIDIAAVIFLVFIISGGVVSFNIASSMPKMLVFLCFTSMYFIIKNIIRSEKLIESCVKCISYSSVIVSSIGIVSYLIGDVSRIWQDTNMFYNIPGRAVSTFDNPNVLGEYLIIVIPVVFAMLLVSQKASEKILFFSSFILCSCCLIFTWSRGAWLGFAFAVILFIVLKSHRVVAYVALFTPAILFALSFLLNRNMIDRISSIGNTADSSTLYRLNIWIGSVNMLKDTFLYGIGIGTEAFSSVYPMYALAGTETAPHTHSLYLQIISETGIFSLITFIILILSFISIVFSYLRYTSQKKARILPIGCFCGIMAFLVQGLTDYVWYNYRIYLLFWMMLGLSVAIIRLYTENERKKFLYV